jgi:hypothetical protein
MTKEQLIQKVYRCIDETYPDTTEQDLEEFNIPAFLDEAVRWVVNVVPVGALGGGEDKTSDANPEDGEEGCVSLELGEDFLRLIEFKMKGWKTSVTQALSQDNPKYWQQQNPALRGGNSRPVVFLISTSGDSKKLEVYPLGNKVDVFRVFEMEIGGDGSFTDAAYKKYPYKLLDITAWKTAELVFSMMQDANGVSVAQAHIQQILPTL